MSQFEWITIVLMIGLNAVFAAYEIALASVSMARLQTLAKYQRPGIRAAVFMKQNMEASLATVQLGITLVGAIAAVTGGAGAEESIVPYLQERFGCSERVAEFLALALVVVPLSAVTIVVGELVPKVFALRNKERIVVALSPLMRIFSLAAYPAVWLFERSVAFVIRAIETLKPGSSSGSAEASELQELRAAVALAHTSRLIGDREERIILGASYLGARSLREILVPADDIAMLCLRDRMSGALVAAHLDMHTRYPVAERRGDPQSIVGYVNFKDIVSALRLSPDEPSLRGIVRELPSLDAHLRVAAALERLIQGHAHMAMVRDRGGTVIGLVTLEDIIEELVGEIHDEYDRLPTYVHAAGSGWVVGGGTPMAHVRQIARLDGTTDRNLSANESLNEWILSRVKSLEAGAELRCDRLKIAVRKVRRRKVLEAQVVPEP